MIDIDALLADAQAHRGEWNVATARDVAGALIHGQNAKIDWDEGAGETWLRIVVAGTVRAYVSTTIPLAMIQHDFIANGPPVERARVVAVDRLDSPELRCSDSVLEAVFGNPKRFDVLNTQEFSADDLWYATV